MNTLSKEKHCIIPPDECTILIKSAGEMASGIAVRLYRAGFRRIVMLETAYPLAVRRTVSFCEALFQAEQNVEGVIAKKANTIEEILTLWQQGFLAVIIDPEWKTIPLLAPEVTIDAVLAKRNIGTTMNEAPLVLALGPGFTAQYDAHYVIETNRGHSLGRIYTEGQAHPNTGIPGNISGYTKERVLRAPCDGTMETQHKIGDVVKKGETICTVNSTPVTASIDGILRGCIRPQSHVRSGLKLGDVDPRGELDNCYTISEKARALGGSVLEAICTHLYSK